MKNPLKKASRSLSTRLSLWIVFFAAIIFMFVMGFMFTESSGAIRREATNRATQVLDNTVQRITNILTKVEVATNNTDWLPARHLDAPDSMFVYCRRILENNPDLNGCSIAFEPYYFKERGRYFSAYSYHEDGKILTAQEGSEQYEYFTMDWYQLPKLLDCPCWTEPYADYDMETVYTPNMVISYCKPIKDKDGTYVGTFAADLSLSWLSSEVSKIKPYPNAYSIMIGRGGTFYVHPDTTKLFYHTIFTETLLKPDTAITRLGHNMQAGKEGTQEIQIEGKNHLVFYKPLGETGCSIAIVCPESDIFGSYYQMFNSMIVIFAIGLLFMLLVLSRIITEELKPLGELAHHADAIAKGDFQEEIPETERKDEVGMLAGSFKHMQDSLASYIEELKHTTASKASMESELKVASNIQMSMLPKIVPPYPERKDINVFGQLIPAKEVGGDLFDFYIRDEKLFFCIGDVSGKGVPASLVMAVTRAQFRTISTHDATPHHIVGRLNDMMAEGNDSNMFVTLFVGVLDLPTGKLRYCNAGHDAPLYIGATTGVLPVDSNIPVGVMSNWKFTCQETILDPNTTLFLYTDGLTEAENIRHELFGEERIIDIVNPMVGNANHGPEYLLETMLNAVNDFVGDADQSDDLTMLAIQYTRHQSDTSYQCSILLTNDVQEVPKLAEFIDKVCADVSVPESMTMNFHLAMEEAVVNVMNYAYPHGKKGNINIVAKLYDDILSFSIIDNGKRFDPTVRAEVDTTLSAEERSIGGLGIHLVRQLMDTINYEYVDDNNILTLSKKIKVNNG